MTCSYPPVLLRVTLAYVRIVDSCDSALTVQCNSDALLRTHASVRAAATLRRPDTHQLTCNSGTVIGALTSALPRAASYVRAGRSRDIAVKRTVRTLYT